MIRRLQVAPIAAIDRDEPIGKPFHERQMEQHEALHGLGQRSARRCDPLHGRRLDLGRELQGRIAGRGGQRLGRLQQKPARKRERR